MSVTISFAEQDYPSLTIESEAPLSEVMNDENAPVRFGCRSGMCGTCTIEVLEGMENFQSLSENEQDTLETSAPGNSQARLACQAKIKGDVKIKYLGK